MQNFTVKVLLQRLQINHKECLSSKTFNFVFGNEMAEPPTKKLKTENGIGQKENGTQQKKDFLERISTQRLTTAESVAKFKFNKKRVRILSEAKDFPAKCQGVLYWMSRDQRVQDNWALLYAQKLALKLNLPLHLCFCLTPKFENAAYRQYWFLLHGLQEVEKECRTLNISFHLLLGDAKKEIPKFVKQYKIGGVVVDFSPLRVPLSWVEDVKTALPKDIPFCQIDAHNIVPCWEASPKLEYGARTIRNKINNQLKEYLTEFPPVIFHPHSPDTKSEVIDWQEADFSLDVDRKIGAVDWAIPGTEGGLRQLESFIKERLKYFGADRNNPNKHALSDMSPWFHFGQVSVQRAMLMVRQYRSKYKESVEGYLEEGIVRRELADNFCFYNKNYDSIEGAYEWAQKTLKDHWDDKREYIYSRQQLEEGKTHDDLWNAAQTQMRLEGKMHGFLRMYWAKKILEWTETPKKALQDAIYLNDRYNLDGRDPNGYVGCMWSICGIHDQGWKERPIFGKIRYMNYAGCQRKFDVKAFVLKYRKKSGSN